MAIVYPGGLDSFTDPIATDRLNSPAHHDQHSDANDAIEALEAKVGENSSSDPTTHDYKLSGVIGIDKAASLAGTETLSNKILANPVLTGKVNDWVLIGTGTYNNASSFKAAGDFSDIYGQGDRVRFKQGGAYIYKCLTATPSYSAPNTTFSVDTLNGVSIANAAITNLYLSKSVSPAGFPSHFDYVGAVATYSGGTTDPTSNTLNYYYYSRVGKLITFSFKYTLVVGTGDRTITKFILPAQRDSTDYLIFSSYTTYNSTTAYGTAYCDDDHFVSLPVVMNQNGVAVVSGSYWGYNS